MTASTLRGRSAPEAVVLSLPFEGLWLAQNSPARRVPSHGTDLWGERFAIDFIGVDARRRSASHRGWRALLATEPPERFFAFGRPILAPADGIVVEAHDGERDHVARRSQLALVPYALGQGARLRGGMPAIAGNSLIVQLNAVRPNDGRGAYVALVHLRAGSIRVSPGDRVTTGQVLAECGNSGNSTQPHLHIQVMDSLDFALALGIPLVFRHFREWPGGRAAARVIESGIPAEGSVVEPLP